MCLVDEPNSPLAPPFFQYAHHGSYRTGCCDAGVQNVRNIGNVVTGELIVILDRKEVRAVPVHTNVVDIRIWQELEHRVNHTKAGTHDRDEGYLLGELQAFRILTNRGVNLDLLRE